MKIQALILFLSVMFWSCAVAPAQLSEVPVHFRIASTNNFDNQEKLMLEDAMVVLNETVNTDAFKRNLLNATFTENGGDSDDVILSKLQKGLPIWGGNSIDMNFIMYTDSKSDIIAYMYPMVPHKVWVNRAHLTDKFELAATVLHETMHHLGYQHLGKWETSVPYHIEDVLRDSFDFSTWYNSQEEYPSNYESIPDSCHL